MDRTADFRRLLAAAATAVGSIDATAAAAAAASVAVPPVLLPPSNGFITAAMEQREMLRQVRREIQHDYSQAPAIQACQEQMAELERLSKDLDDLGPKAPRRKKDLLEHRQGLVRSLYEDLQELASRVQSAQASDLQHEAEVASYFTAAPRVQAASNTTSLKPPPMPSLGDDDALGLRAGEASNSSVQNDEALRAEEQSLLYAYQSDVDQTQETQTKIQEVSALLVMFGQKVTEQQEIIENIHQDVDTSIDNVEQAGKELSKALKNSNAYRFYVMLWFIGSALILLIFDFIDARYSWI